MRDKCSVCYLQVPPGQLALVYEGVHFAFCSEQCRERFRATPHLYVVAPGSTRRHRYHLVAALFEQESGVRITEVDVTATVTDPGMAGIRKRLEPMRISDAITFRSLRQATGDGGLRIFSRGSVMRPPSAEP